MKTPHFRVIHTVMFAAVIALAASPAAVFGQAKKKNPASKLYVSDVAGEAQIDTGEFVEDLAKRSVYTAKGVTIDTKHTDDTPTKKHYSTMVFSNGTGAFFDADTRVEVRNFVQEPFVPTRSDSEMEPSISQTHAFIARGAVGLCTSKLVAGSTMAYTTPHGSVNIRGRKIVISTDANVTKISMLEGESTVRAGVMDMGGQTIHAGEQAIIRPAAPGEPNMIQIIKIPSSEASQLDDKVAMACMAKKTVYFEVRGRNSSDSTGGEVDTFNTEATAHTAGGAFTDNNGEIVAIPVVPKDLPVQFTISPASLTTPNGKTITPGNGNPTPGQGGPPGG